MPAERPGETFARYAVEQILGVRVCRYDRGGNSQPDGIIHRSGGVPLEIVSDPHQADLQRLNALEKRGWTAHIDGLQHGYQVFLEPDAPPLKDLTWLANILRIKEDPALQDLFSPAGKGYSLIVAEPTLAPGEIAFSASWGHGGPMLATGDLAQAASEILSRPAYADVARKLERYGGTERHAYVIGDAAKSSTFRSLMNLVHEDLDGEPAPTLPSGITDLWIGARHFPQTVAHWSAADGWTGYEWAWLHPKEILTGGWDDPDCSDHGS
jgi:hypothetical protein